MYGRAPFAVSSLCFLCGCVIPMILDSQYNLNSPMLHLSRYDRLLPLELRTKEKKSHFNLVFVKPENNVVLWIYLVFNINYPIIPAEPHWMLGFPHMYYKVHVKV